MHQRSPPLSTLPAGDISDQMWTVPKHTMHAHHTVFAGNNPSPWHSQGLVGSLPASLAQLHQLNVLNLELNSLTGELPAGLCYPGAPLRALKLRGNILRGKMAQLTNCSELSQLDISANDFGGPLWMGPSSASAGSVWSQLAVLDASGNQVGT
jgi:hypothetical protein